MVLVICWGHSTMCLALSTHEDYVTFFPCTRVCHFHGPNAGSVQLLIVTMFFMLPNIRTIYLVGMLEQPDRGSESILSESSGKSGLKHL